MRKLACLASVAVVATAIAVPVALSAGRDQGRQGIVVHGKWQLVVRSHGKVVKVRRFENSLVTDGAKALIKLLAPSTSMGRWAVELNGSNPGTTATNCNANGIQFCWISTEASVTSAFIGPATHNLVPSEILDTPELQLKGSINATADATIGQVVSAFDTCDIHTTPTACTGSTGFSIFTVANLSQGVSVTAGQQVAITVHFTFS